MLRCQGFRQDSFLDDPGRVRVSPPSASPAVACPKLQRMNSTTSEAAIIKERPIPTGAGAQASPVLPLAEERAEGYRRGKRSLASEGHCSAGM
jgi:hypothetical protein